MGEREGEDRESPPEYEVTVTELAEFDIQDAVDYYDAQSVGLGSAFLDEVRNVLTNLSRHRLMYVAVKKSLRRALLRRFPYGLFYTFDGQEVKVLACLHGARNPRKWERLI